ncbi:hypothetical protein MJ575_22865 [Klebsiella pneumoniae]|nr:hypothetical protein MJ575_22865 [Klebsiella pneumoniae]
MARDRATVRGYRHDGLQRRVLHNRLLAARLTFIWRGFYSAVCTAVAGRRRRNRPWSW